MLRLYVYVKDLSRRLTTKDEGATMVEYGIMIALIAAICIGTIVTIGTAISSAFVTVNTELN